MRTNGHQKISHNKLLLVEYFQTAKNAMRAILPLTGQLLAVLNTNNEHGLKGSKNRQRWLTEDWISRPFTTQTSLLLETFFLEYYFSCWLEGTLRDFLSFFPKLS